MNDKIEGFVYTRESAPGLFANAAAGVVLRNPDRSAPWLVVNHTIESTIVARWPGKLWRVVVLDAEGVEQASAHAHYTRAVAVRVVEEVPASLLFGAHGDAVIQVLSLASCLEPAAVEMLVAHRHPEADRAYSRSFYRWLGRVGRASDYSGWDLSRTLSAGPFRSPLNDGLSLVYHAVEDRAKAVGGPRAFVKDDEGEDTLGNVWGTAAAALLDAAMALGAPADADEDVGVLLTAWKVVTDRHSSDDLGPLS